MKKIINLYLLPLMLLWGACSEDVNPDPQLAGPLYGLAKGEPGSVEELVYQTWEYCGVYYLWDYGDYAFQVTNWSGYFNKWYTPVKEENKELVKMVIHAIQNEVFAGMDGDYIRRNWFVRVFLCDSLCNDYDYNSDKVVNTYLQNEDMLIIPNLGERMKEYTEEDWTNWKKEFSSLLVGRLYLGATEEPTAFFDLRYKNPTTGKEATAIFTNAWEEDPDEKYSPGVYTFHKYGYVRSKSDGWSSETVLIVDRKTDVADYINFLTMTEKTEMDYIWAHFPKMLERAIALIPYLEDVLGLDIVTMQNANCPHDAVETDYYKNLSM